MNQTVLKKYPRRRESFRRLLGDQGNSPTTQHHTPYGGPEADARQRRGREGQHRGAWKAARPRPFGIPQKGASETFESMGGVNNGLGAARRVFSTIETPQPPPRRWGRGWQNTDPFNIRWAVGVPNEEKKLMMFQPWFLPFPFWTFQKQMFRPPGAGRHGEPVCKGGYPAAERLVAGVGRWPLPLTHPLPAAALALTLEKKGPGCEHARQRSERERPGCGGATHRRVASCAHPLAFRTPAGSYAGEGHIRVAPKIQRGKKTFESSSRGVTYDGVI